ncbi:3-hydroxyacyl-CoA dehydrogenase NAD-binding domain-containing protein [Paraburkholderia sp. HP33-1]|uniref:3-hydroxyacyl-CoA dehydrogenase NAD-binding domain-containing protein n=1 Tax=Paraburkholderia sp. HP33-1 TaxID=2883243 RepID=UPI001F235122|nr:3-hydroxyacyl-CoA dehydrogenase NAD-binding domain-containing protein [Paraburkholderia sp. HP33-1]
MSVSEHLDGGILVLTLSHPPVNAIATPLRAALWRGLQRAETDDAIRGVVIHGAGGLFSAGADLQEFTEGRAFDTPSFHGDVLPYIAAMRKPVVAALEGRAIGGGFELALWCHARVAAADCLLGLPETTLGLMPGAGGTQLLPRAIGLERATSLIVSGRLERAATFDGTALLDGLVPASELISAAHSLASSLASGAVTRLHLSERVVSHPQPDAFLQFARSQARVRRDFVPSMLLAIDAIEMSLACSAIEGMAREFEMFRPLVGSPAARAIRHAFFAERRAPRIEDLPAGTSPRAVLSAAVVGAGFMGTGIAHCLARAGIPVKLFDEKPDAAARAAAALSAQAETGGNVEAVERLEDLASADLVIEAIVEQLDAKSELFARLDRTVKAGAILATNTSTLDVDAIAAATERPADVLGLHFFGPAPVMRLLEIVRGARTSPQVLATALELARRMRKVAIVSRVSPGFIGNRIFDVLVTQALALAAEGVRPADVDAALEAEGWRMGPFRTMDLIGHDVLTRARAHRPPTAGEAIQDRLVIEGRLGQKTGKGWYRYSADGRRAMPDPAIDTLLPSEIAKKPSASAIAQRCLFAMVNEGARVLKEGVAQRASDIDVAFLLGYGFSRLLGGPMFAATELGLGRACQQLEALASETGDDRFLPAPLLQQCAQDDGRWHA